MFRLKLLLFGAVALPVFAAPLSVDSLITKAESQDLYHSKEWERILYYTKGALGFSQFIIESKDFYLCPGNERDLKCEMESTLKAIFQPQTDPGNVKSQHAQCVFPYRTKFLKEHLNIPDEALPKVICSKLFEWEILMKSEAVSLVFSSSYLNNPGSMFGHTFLRFHKKNAADTSATSLLDPTVSFAASETSPNPILYVVGGIFGWFNGSFSMAPYYLKVQEYNNSERRDLWEFEMDLSPEEIKNMGLSLWEVGPRVTNYYFLHRNCALLPIALIDAASTRSNLMDRVPRWLIPADSVRVISEEPTMVRNVHYRPSTLSRFETRYNSLTLEEKQEVLSIFSSPFKDTKARLAQNGSSKKFRILDAALDYIEFDEKLGGSKLSEKYADVQREILSMRSKQDALPEHQVVETPKLKQPNLGHDTSRISLGALVGSSRGTTLSTLSWRPALHSLEDNSLGYSPELSIRFMDTEFSYDLTGKEFDLRNFELLQVTSITPMRGLITPLSTSFSLGREWTPNCTPSQEDCHRSRLRFGGGAAISPFSQRFIVYGLALANMGYVSDDEVRWHIGPELEVGTRLQLTDSIQWVNTGSVYWRYGVYPMRDTRLKSNLQWQIEKNLGFLVSGEYFNDTLWWGTKLHLYL